ncbi:UAA transporter family protein [Nitzschia inconspicua]|uniref:UAA transporter family protein n=1 Tax=Nitzschia inconspicua TaxID=303405 RepID=A0A9K3PRJ6_9STRA|nr:UAA transporter family protein [Nitzschia inconspicua]KAG7356771.1 UAA transporter family protein [Nitzschia inconspicua]
MVDFVDLAESSRWLLERFLGDANDDFVNLEAADGSGPAAVTGIANDNVLLQTFVYEDLNVKTSPFFSKSAEAELYLLCTNFLLYVAMVIITTIVAKVYFPQSLERDVSAPIPRKYSYRRQLMENNQHQSSDDEDDALYSDDDDDDEGGEEGTGSGGSRSNEQFLGDIPPQHTPTHHSPHPDPLGLGATSPHGNVHEVELDDEEGERLILASNVTPRSRLTARVLEFDQETTSKAKVIQRLLLCSLMLNITFVTWGALQERMLTRRYPRYTGDYFTYSYALVFTNRFWTLVMSGILLWYLKPRLSRSTVIYEFSFPSISNMLSSWCQYEALKYVSFPATTLFKSFKLAPVMLMGKLMGNKSYPAYDYIVAMVIGIGVALFMSSTDDLRFSFSQDYLGNAEVASAKWTGVMLLCFFLLFDSFTSQFQSRMFQRHLDLSIVELMFATSAFSTVLSAITLVHTKELSPALAFVLQHSEIHLHFFMFSICSTIGQLFIFYTIKNFGAVVFTLIMTTRILLSIALSCIMWGHPVTAVGFLGLTLVLGAVLFRIKKKAEGQQLIKWQGMEDDKGKELVQEWHEHLDM